MTAQFVDISSCLLELLVSIVAQGSRLQLKLAFALRLQGSAAQGDTPAIVLVLHKNLVGIHHQVGQLAL